MRESGRKSCVGRDTSLDSVVHRAVRACRVTVRAGSLARALKGAGGRSGLRARCAGLR
ncbi:MAG: hypothetical protein WAW52_02195 [Methanothrix sp.]